MSDGRTYWWAKDAAWYRREHQSAIALSHGPIGLSALDWLCCHAKELNDAGRVKSGYSAIALGIGAPHCLPEITSAIQYAATIGALDDFEEHEDGMRFRCRISGWEADQSRAANSFRQARHRAKQRDDMASPERDTALQRNEEQRQKQRQSSPSTEAAVGRARRRWRP